MRWVPTGPREKWLGRTARLPTGQIITGGVTITARRPQLVDFQSFIAALDSALVATRDDSAKWDASPPNSRFKDIRPTGHAEAALIAHRLGEG